LDGVLFGNKSIYLGGDHIGIDLFVAFKCINSIRISLLIEENAIWAKMVGMDAVLYLVCSF